MPEETPASHQPPFAVPSVEEMSAFLPQYAFEKLAAFGGMGAVYKARQESLDRPVAIKILPPEFGTEADFAERFKAEARAMAKLNHTNIVGVIDFGLTAGGHLYLVMEWVQGPTLHEMIQKGSIPVKKAANLAMQLCDALSYAHSHRILHRDIKPGNIMVNEEGQVKVTDFGLARPITGEAEENPYGTPDYAAPEILGKGGVDQRADIYAAGVVLYEMLTGRVPKQPRRSVTEYAPVSPRWDEVIDKAMHPEPAKRFQDARDFRADISMLLHQAAQALAVPVAEIVEETAEPRRGLTPLHWVLVGTTVVVAGIYLGAKFGSGPEKKERAKKVLVQTPSEGAPEKKKPLVVEDDKPQEPAVVMLEPEPEKKTPKPRPEKKMAETPVPEPMPAPATPPAPMPENPRDAIQRLEARDPELAQLVEAFAVEWSANDAINTDSKEQELAGKYIPALQRALPGLMPEQRDHVLSEISHVANREPLNEPATTWPPVLKNLRSTYDGQLQGIRANAEAAADKMRSAQCELVLARAGERAAAGRAEDAKLAEAVAAELARLRDAPSVRALKESVRMTSSQLAAPEGTNSAAGL